METNPETGARGKTHPGLEKGMESRKEQPEKVATDYPWGSYSLGTVLIISWFYLGFLRAFYGGVIHLTSLFGCMVSAVLLFVYGTIMFIAAGGLLSGVQAGIKIASAGLFVSGVGHIGFVWVNRSESVWFETIAAVAAVVLGVRYILSENTSELVLQPESGLPAHIKVLQALLAGFGLICLAAIILTMWEAYGRVPLGVP